MIKRLFNNFRIKDLILYMWAVRDKNGSKLQIKHVLNFFRNCTKLVPVADTSSIAAIANRK